MNDVTVIVIPVDVSILREDLRLGDEAGYHNPRPARIYEAWFDWAPGMRSEDFRFLRGFGATEEEAVAALHQEKEHVAGIA